MASALTLPRARMRPLTLTLIGLTVLVLALIAGRTLFAQVEGDRGIAAVVASSDIDVGGIEIDVTGDSAEDARQKGWKLAQREAWKKVGGPAISDGQLQGLVSAIVVEQERISSKRYVARLGVIFDRQRAGGMLGRGGQRTRSAPMLLMPVTLSAGTTTIYEKRNPWQKVWAEYQAGSSRIDYVRPSGAGGDSLLLTYGQASRRSRTWWRNILDQFEAADVLVAVASLRHQWPGGPIEGEFTARYGPDNTYLDSFTLRAESENELEGMLRQAVERFDESFEQALVDGKLRPDPTLNFSSGAADPALQRLIELGRQAESADRARAAAAAAAAEGGTAVAAPTPTATVAAPAVVASYVVQFATPDAASFDAAVSSVRGTAGVRGIATSSTAIGGTSVMSVSFGGSMDQLAAALRARGFTVRQGSNALAISR